MQGFCHDRGLKCVHVFEKDNILRASECGIHLKLEIQESVKHSCRVLDSYNQDVQIKNPNVKNKTKIHSLNLQL